MSGYAPFESIGEFIIIETLEDFNNLIISTGLVPGNCTQRHHRNLNKNLWCFFVCYKWSKSTSLKEIIFNRVESNTVYLYKY